MLSEDMFAVVYIMDFSLQAVLRVEDALVGEAVALVEEISRRALIVEMSSSARTRGVELGMTASQGKARCADLILRSRNAEAEKSAAEVLFTCAYTLSPHVEETARDWSTVDLRGVDRIDLEARGRKVIAMLETAGMEGRIGFAATPCQAYYAARLANPILLVQENEDFLEDLPLQIANPLPEHQAILEQWGILRLGALAALSRQEIGKRLGEEGVALWDRARGRDSRLLKVTPLPEKFEERYEFEQEQERLDPILFILRRILVSLCFRLEAAYHIAEAMTLKLELEDRSIYRRNFRIPEPNRDPDMLLRMLHTHLESLKTESPVVAVALYIEPGRQKILQQGLFETRFRDQRRFAETLGQLAALVGSERVGSPRREAGYRPDAFSMEKLGESIPPPAPEPVLGPLGLPLRRWRPPSPARVEIAKAKPVRVHSAVARGSLRVAVGPWRSSGQWWDRNYWRREEWDVEFTAGGLYRLVRQEDTWSVEGVYD